MLRLTAEAARNCLAGPMDRTRPGSPEGPRLHLTLASTPAEPKTATRPPSAPRVF